MEKHRQERMAAAFVACRNLTLEAMEKGAVEAMVSALQAIQRDADEIKPGVLDAEGETFRLSVLRLTGIALRQAGKGGEK